jgi:hypothetical protein
VIEIAYRNGNSGPMLAACEQRLRDAMASINAEWEDRQRAGGAR